MPPSVVGADSVNQIKRNLDTHWVHLQYIPPMPMISNDVTCSSTGTDNTLALCLSKFLCI